MTSQAPAREYDPMDPALDADPYAPVSADEYTGTPVRIHGRVRSGRRALGGVGVSDGRRVKQVLDLNRAEWNAMGQRIVPVASEHEDAREKRLREKEAKKAQKEAAREQEYIAATGD